MRNVISSKVESKMTNLNSNSTDRLVSVAKGVVGACPFIGPLVSEAIGTLIPKQRLDRVIDFLRTLEEVVQSLDKRFMYFETNLKSSEGLCILEDGLIQAAHSTSAERKNRLAHLVAHSLSDKEIKFEESRKLLNLFRDLTDPEIIWLIFYSMNPDFDAGPHQDFAEKHPEVIKPISREVGVPQEQIDRAALQDSYKNTLLRYGLIKLKGKTHRITTLGRLLVRYIGDYETVSNEK